MRWRSVILLLKPAKSPTDENSYRPISLLEILYKIISGVFAERLKKVTKFIIGHHQKGYMEGRNATENVRATQDIRDFAVHNNLPLAILGIDFSKASDNISHQGLFKIMEYFGFPEKFINFLRILLKDAQIILDVNGFRSQPFLLKDGTGQGDPISSFLFNLCIELFIIKLQFHHFTRMFMIGQFPATPEAFADDVHLYLAGDYPNNISAITKIAVDFAKLSGLHLYTQKTEFLSIGASQEMCDKARECGLKIVDKIKFVGAWVTACQGTMETALQFEKPIKKIELVDRSWAWRKPSPYGATIIIRSLMASTTTHLLSNFDMGDQQLQYLSNNFRQLLWSSTNRHHTRKYRIIQPISRGGMNIISIPDFTMALRIQWYRKLCQSNPTTQNWRTVLNQYLDKYGITDTDIPFLGWRDMKRLGAKLIEDKHIFWGKNFQHLSTIAKLWEESTTSIGMLPFFGGLIQDKAESS